MVTSYDDCCVDNENTCYAKLLSANTTYIQSIIDAERLELQLLLDEEEETVRLCLFFQQQSLLNGFEMFMWRSFYLTPSFLLLPMGVLV